MKLSVVYSFLIPVSGPDGFRQAVEQLCEAVVGAKTSHFDIAKGPGRYSANRSAFSHSVDRVGPVGPRSTCSRCRGGHSGPQPWRGLHGWDRYGLCHFQQAVKGNVRLRTLLAVRAAASRTGARKLGCPLPNWNPPETVGRVILHDLGEQLHVSDLPDLVKTVACQGMYVVVHSKETEFLESVALSRVHTKFEHIWRRWRKPSSGHRHLGSHPPLRGKLGAVPADERMDDQYRTRVTSDLEFLTRKTAAYTWDLSFLLADTPVL